MKFYAVSQLENKRLRIQSFERFRQIRNHIELIVNFEKSVKEKLNGVFRIRVGIKPRIERDRRSHRGEHQTIRRRLATAGRDGPQKYCEAKKN